MTERYPIITAYLTGQLLTRVDALAKRLLEMYPHLSEARAKELAGAYLLITYRKELIALDNEHTAAAETLQVMMEHYPASFGDVMQDLSGSRTLLLDETEINLGLCAFPLYEPEV